MKKTLAILLSLALVICMIPASAATAFADDGGYEVTLSKDTFTYNGTPQAPTVTVQDGNGAVSSSAYKITYAKQAASGESGSTYGKASEAVPTDAGTYQITVTEKSPAQGKTEKTGQATYTIAPLSLTDTTNKIVIRAEGKISDAYNANSTVPFDQSGLTVYMNGYTNSKIFNNDNLTVTVTTVDSSKKVATVKVEGKAGGNITGSVTGLEVSQAAGLTSTNCKVTASKNPEYNGKAQSVYLTVKYTVGTSTTTLKQGTDFTVSPSSVTDVSETEFTITGKGSYAGSFSVSGVDYIEPKKVGTSNGTNNVNVSVIPTQVIGAQPAITVTDVVGGKTVDLKKGIDYNCNINTSVQGSGKGQATVTFSGNYTGKRTQTFDVVSADYDLASATVYRGDTTSSYTYSGYTQKPADPTVYIKPDGGSTKYLTKGTDYTISYRYKDEDEVERSTTSPIDANTYTIVLEGKGSYGGEYVVGTFTIKQYYMGDAAKSVTVTSATSAPAVTVTTKAGKSFVKDTDYTVSWYPTSSNTKVYVTISSLSNNLYGTYSNTYSVNPKSISSCTAYFSDGKSSEAYTGSTITKTVVVKDGSTTLTQGTHYNVTIKNSSGSTVSTIKDAGTYTFTITGTGGYTGSTSLSFTVTGNDISAYTVTLDKTSIQATGGAVTLPKVTKVYSGSVTLSSSEYTVSYQNEAGSTVSSASAPGTYKVIVTGAGKYSGKASAAFKIIGLDQKITGVSSTYKKYKTSKAFQLTPSATEGTFTYSSSDSSVATVSSTGLVTPLKAGRAKITIKTTGTSKYNQAEYSTIIKVYPNKAVLTQKPWTTESGKIKVRWNKQEGVTRYEVRYSRVKTFAEGTYSTKKASAAVNSYDTQSTTIKNLKSGYKYYVKVRAVTEVYNDSGKKLTYYGNWSKWKSVVAK